MVMAVWLAVAFAEPAVCDPVEALRLVDEARVDPVRAPLTHPGLVPGLALAGRHVDPALQAALAGLCSTKASISVSEVDRWEAMDWAAVSLAVVRTETRGCSLVERSIIISVGIGQETPRYRLMGRRPMASTPIGACTEQARWWSERILDARGGVQLLAVGEAGSAKPHTELVVRRATPDGWVQHPISPEVVEGAHLAKVQEDTLVVLPPAAGCGTTPSSVFTWQESSWTQHSGRDAAHQLIVGGLWRELGVSGWVVVLSSDEGGSAELIEPRRRRIQRRWQETLFVYEAGSLPGLERGGLVVAPRPYLAASDAEAVRRGRAVVHKAWDASCDGG
jgi:hypothetical protein